MYFLWESFFIKASFIFNISNNFFFVSYFHFTILGAFTLFKMDKKNNNNLGFTEPLLRHCGFYFGVFCSWPFYNLCCFEMAIVIGKYAESEIYGDLSLTLQVYIMMFHHGLHTVCTVGLFIWGLTSLSTLYRSYHDG